MVRKRKGARWVGIALGFFIAMASVVICLAAVALPADGGADLLTAVATKRLLPMWPWGSTARLGTDRPTPLLITRSLWASGFHAKFNQVPQRTTGSAWLEWNADAEVIFAQHYFQVHFPSEGCSARASKVSYAEARIDMEWGVTSAMRDIEDQLLYGLLTGQFVVFSPYIEDQTEIQEAMAQYQKGCRGGLVWIEDCYFENLTGCTGDFLAGELPITETFLDRRTALITEDPLWFLEKSQPIWKKMAQAGAIIWHSGSAGGSNTNLYSQDSPVQMSDGERAATLLAMFRALLLQVAFRPSAALKRAIQGVEGRTGLACVAASTASCRGALAVVHVRRTDKATDFNGGSQDPSFLRALEESAETGVATTLDTISNVLLPLLDSGRAQISGLFLMSDDPRAFPTEARTLLTRRLQNASAQVMYDPESKRFTPEDETILRLGHQAWGHKAELGMQVLAESYAAARWAHYIVGCGSSGVSQLVAQLLGGRFHMDPNILGLWEDGYLDVEAATAAAMDTSRTVSALRGSSQSTPWLQW